MIDDDGLKNAAETIVRFRNVLVNAGMDPFEAIVYMSLLTTKLSSESLDRFHRKNRKRGDNKEVVKKVDMKVVEKILRDLDDTR